MADELFEVFRETGEITLEVQRKSVEAQRRGESRRSFFRSSAAALAGSAVMGAGVLEVLKPATAFASGKPGCSDSYQEILDIAATAELLAVTFYYEALQAGSALPKVNSKANQNYFQAAVTQEYIHEEILASLGASPLATSFYFPDSMFSDETVFFHTSELLERYFISAYITAARAFSGLTSTAITKAKPLSIGLAMQIAGIECEHRALLRVAGNRNPPNNLAIEKDLIHCVSDAATALGPFLSGGTGFSGTPIPVPSMSAVNTAAAPFDFSYFPEYDIV